NIQMDGITEDHTCLGDFNGDGQLDLLASGIWKHVSFRANDVSYKVKSIDHANKSLDVEYEAIPRYDGYTQMSTGDAKFLSRTLPLKVVKRLYDDVTLDNKYSYGGLVFHKFGLGFRGFQKFAIKNSLNQSTYQTYNLTSRVPYLTESQVFDAFGTMSYGSLTTYQQIDVDGGASGRSRIIMSNSET